MLALLIAVVGPSRAACTITDLAPSDVIQTEQLAPRFTFVATRDCAALQFLAEDGLLEKAPRRSSPTPGGDLRYDVTLSEDEWASVTGVENETLGWSIVGVADDGARTRVTITNELDLDIDSATRGHDCDDADESVGSCVLALDDYDLLFETESPSGAPLWPGRLAVADLTGDGAADIVLGDTATGSGIYVMDGAARTVDTDDAIEIRAGARDDRFAYRFDAGDFDGDDQADLLVASADVPAVYLFSGPLTASMHAGAAYARLAADQGPHDVDVAADHDGDGHPDLVVGLPGAGEYLQGAVLVAPAVDAGDGSLSSVATHAYRGKRSFGSLGENELDVGDTDGDGVSDLALVATTSRRHPGVGVYVVAGGSDPGSYFVDDVAAATLTETKTKWTQFGHAMAGTDYDDDGLADLLVTAPSRDVEWNDGAGTVYAFLGPVSGALTPDDAPIRWEGRDRRCSALGYSVSVGRADVGASPDVLMTCVGTHPGYLQLGLATGVVSSADLVPLDSGSLGMLYADGSAFVPDWTGDHNDEILVGIDDPAGRSVGGVYVLFSDSWF